MQGSPHVLLFSSQYLILEQSSSNTHSRMGTQIPRIILMFEPGTFECMEVNLWLMVSRLLKKSQKSITPTVECRLHPNSQLINSHFKKKTNCVLQCYLQVLIPFQEDRCKLYRPQRELIPCWSHRDNVLHSGQILVLQDTGHSFLGCLDSVLEDKHTRPQHSGSGLGQEDKLELNS